VSLDLAGMDAHHMVIVNGAPSGSLDLAVA